MLFFSLLYIICSTYGHVYISLFILLCYVRSVFLNLCFSIYAFFLLLFSAHLLLYSSNQGWTSSLLPWTSCTRLPCNSLILSMHHLSLSCAKFTITNSLLIRIRKTGQGVRAVLTTYIAWRYWFIRIANRAEEGLKYLYFFISARYPGQNLSKIKHTLHG